MFIPCECEIENVPYYVLHQTRKLNSVRVTMVSACDGSMRSLTRNLRRDREAVLTLIVNGMVVCADKRAFNLFQEQFT